MSQKVSYERGRLYGQMCDLRLLAISLAPLLTFVATPFFLSCFIYGSITLSLSLCYEPTHIQMRGEPFPAHRQTASAVRAYCPPCFAYLSQPDK